jgi:hypothetical protein
LRQRAEDCPPYLLPLSLNHYGLDRKPFERGHVTFHRNPRKPGKRLGD